MKFCINFMIKPTINFELDAFQKVLAAHGASKISAYVTHGIFPNRSWTRFQHDNGGKLFTLTIV